MKHEFDFVESYVAIWVVLIHIFVQYFNNFADNDKTSNLIATSLLHKRTQSLSIKSVCTCLKKNVQGKVCVCQQRIRKMFYYSEWNEKTTKIVLFREKFIFVDNFTFTVHSSRQLVFFLPSIMTIKCLKNI